ncbi:MAG: DUF2490 domain-containing protein [Flavobacteriales bacterium]
MNLSESKLHAQTSEIWFGYITSSRISERSALWNDFHYVGTSFLALRTGYTFFPHQNVDITAGYAYVITATPFSTQLIRPEDRPWGQIVWRYFPLENIRLRSRFRYDARFRRNISDSEVLSDIVLAHRLRIMQDVRYQIKRWSNNRKLHFNIMYEGLFNAGPHGRRGTDQHRYYLLPGFQFGNFNLMVGTHLRSIRTASGNNIRYGACFWLTHIFDLRKRQ